MRVLLPLFFALVYAALDTRVQIQFNVDVNSLQSALSVSVRAWGMAARFDGLLVKEGHGLAIRVEPRYPKAKDDKAKPPPDKLTRQQRWKESRCFVLPVLRCIESGIIALRVRIGLDDAAATAMTAGAIRSAAAGIMAYLGIQIPSEIRVEPDFGKAGFVMHAHGVFAIKPGDAIGAMVMEVVRQKASKGLRTSQRKDGR